MNKEIFVKMLKVNRLLYLLALLSLCLFSCKDVKDNSVVEIDINFDNVEKLDLNAQKICLSLPDGNVMDRIDDIYQYKNKYIFIRTRRGISVFDKNGVYLFNVGRKGNGPGEYSNLNSFFVKEDSIHIYDAMAKKILYYNMEGSFIGEKNLKEKYTEITPNQLYPLPDGKYVSRNIYGGESQKVYSYGILDKNFEYSYSIEDRFLKNGITVLKNLYVNEDYLLFCELINDTIFSIDREKRKSTPKYFVNFNEKSFPLDVKNKDLYDALMFSNKPENKNKYASVISNVYESDTLLTFTFIYQRNLYYVKYNKNTKKTKTYLLTYRDFSLGYVLYIDKKEHKLYIPVESSEESCLLVVDDLMD